MDPAIWYWYIFLARYNLYVAIIHTTKNKNVRKNYQYPHNDLCVEVSQVKEKIYDEQLYYKMRNKFYENK